MQGCGRTFGALTGTALSGLHHKKHWLAFAASLAEGETIKESAEGCGIAPSTAHRWRHRFLAAALDIPHERIDASAGERVRGALHIRTVNSRHSRIKGFLRGFRGIATKYLDSYLRWFHLIELGDPPSPGACLEAAMAKPCLRLAN